MADAFTVGIVFVVCIVKLISGPKTVARIVVSIHVVDRNDFARYGRERRVIEKRRFKTGTIE